MTEQGRDDPNRADADASPNRPPGAESEPARSRKGLRRWLLVLGPGVAIMAGGYIYLTSGRFASTDNAYVKADKVVVSPEVAGTIVRVATRENGIVSQGDLLFVIDDRSYRVGLARAQAQLEAVSAMLESQRSAYAQQLEQLAIARNDAAYKERELARQQALVERKLASEADLDRARHDAETARDQIKVDEQTLAQLRAQLGGKPDAAITEHPGYRSMLAARDAAALDLANTQVRAPFAGIASKVPMVGQYVAPGSAAMSVVSNSAVWIEANYKETDLTYVEVGQPVSVHVDTYPGRDWHGQVESIGQATGAEFSVLPAQNASGNWVKVTQRIPVRIRLERSDDDPVLRAGMSTEVEIDIGTRHTPLAGMLDRSVARESASQRADAKL